MVESELGNVQALNTNEEIYEDISKYLTSFNISTTFGTDFDLSLVLQGLENLLQKINDQSQKILLVDFESLLTSIVFLLKESKENQGDLIKKFCSIVVDNQNSPKYYPIIFKSLLCLFRLMDDKRPIKCSIYCSLLKMVKTQTYLSYVETDMKVLKNWFNLWRLNYDEIRNVIKQLYETLALCDKEEQGLAILNESLKLCQKEKAELGKEDARRSLILHIKNPKVFIFDHFLNIPLVASLESEPVYQLFQIFLKMKLMNYMKFYQENKDFVDEIGLNHDDNVYKMRILTFLQMAADAKEIAFKSIVQELSLDSAEVEDFIINVVRSKMVRCKIDELGQKVTVDFAANRVFDKDKWSGLETRLADWITSLTLASKGIKELKDLEGYDFTLEDYLLLNSHSYSEGRGLGSKYRPEHPEEDPVKAPPELTAPPLPPAPYIPTPGEGDEGRYGHHAPLPPPESLPHHLGGEVGMAPYPHPRRYAPGYYYDPYAPLPYGGPYHPGPYDQGGYDDRPPVPLTPYYGGYGHAPYPYPPQQEDYHRPGPVPPGSMGGGGYTRQHASRPTGPQPYRPDYFGRQPLGPPDDGGDYAPHGPMSRGGGQPPSSYYYHPQQPGPPGPYQHPYPHHYYK